ncbi:MAG: glycosyltransferase family 4 protein [Saprospiraceae bacterium]
MSAPILLLSSEFPPQPGGIGSHAYNLARVLASAGYAVTVLTNARGKGRAAEQAFDAALPFRVRRTPRSCIALFTYLSRVAGFLFFLFKNPRCTVIASGKFSLWMGAAGNLFFPKNRYVGIVHGTEINPDGAFSKWLTRKSLAAYDPLVAVSNFTKNLVLKTLPHPNVVVVNNGFDPEKFMPRNPGQASEMLQEKHGSPALITIGSLSQRKGQHNVVRALPILRAVFPKVRYHIVGLPNGRKHLEKLAEELGVRDCVEIHGALDDAATSALLHASDVFVMLSENTPDGDVEGFGIAILEANAAGLPAIGSRACGIEDAIRDGFSGRLVNGHDAQELLSALKGILENHSVYAANARLWAEGFTWQQKGKEYLRLIS